MKTRKSRRNAKTTTSRRRFKREGEMKEPALAVRDPGGGGYGIASTTHGRSRGG